MPKALQIAHLFWCFPNMFWPLSHYQDNTFKHTLYYQILLPCYSIYLQILLHAFVLLLTWQV